MVASVPELTRRTMSSTGTAAQSTRASSTSPGVEAPKLVPSAAAAATAATTAGAAWPRIKGPQEPT